MKLSEIKGEDALDVLAELIDPIASIGMNEAVKNADRSNRVEFIKTILKECKTEIIEMLAALERKPVDEYRKEMSLATLPSIVADLFGDQMVAELFGLQSQTEETSSGSATENTEAKGK